MAKGNFINTTSMQVAQLSQPTEGRYFKFVALSEINGNKWTSAAEIGIKAEAITSAVQGIIEYGHPLNSGIYDLQGIKRADDVSMASNLPKGIYIYKGKKVIR